MTSASHRHDCQEWPTGKQLLLTGKWSACNRGRNVPNLRQYVPGKATTLDDPPTIKNRIEKGRKCETVEVGLLFCKNMFDWQLALIVYVKYEIDLLLFSSTLA
jgi:hypothetical protein